MIKDPARPKTVNNRKLKLLQFITTMNSQVPKSIIN